MKVIRLLASGALIAILATMTATHPLGASANAPALHLNVVNTADYSNYNYDIEAGNSYCRGGGISCVANDGVPANGDLYSSCHLGTYVCAALNFAYTYIVGQPGETTGTPEFAFAECSKYTTTGYSDISVGVLPSYNIGPSSDLGVISGKGTLFDWFQSNPNFPPDDEGNTAQTSSIAVSAYDTSGEDYYGTSSGEKGARFTVTGVQNTDNTTDSLNDGLFTITITGRIFHYLPGSTTPSGSTWGTMSCQAGGPHAADLFNAGYDRAGETYLFYGEFSFFD